MSAEDLAADLRALSDFDLARRVKRECCPPLALRDVAGLVVLRAVERELRRRTDADDRRILREEILSEALSAPLREVDETCPGLLSAAGLKPVTVTLALEPGRLVDTSAAAEFAEAHRLRITAERWLAWYRDTFYAWREPRDERETLARGIARLVGAHPQVAGGIEAERRAAASAARKRPDKVTAEDLMSAAYALGPGKLRESRLLMRRDGQWALSPQAYRNLMRPSESKPSKATEAGLNTAATSSNPLEALETIEAIQVIEAAIEARRALPTKSKALALVREHALALLRGEVKVDDLADRSGLDRSGLDRAWAREREAVAQRIRECRQ